jgi:hypothetical protein
VFERRPFFVIGDLVCNALAGAVVAMSVVRLVDGGWPMPVGMLVGMVAGSLLALLLAMGVSTVLGALEVMLPMMTTGMVVGMLAGMGPATGIMTTGAAATNGTLVGVVVLVGTYILNAYVRSRGDVWTP